MVLLLTPEEAAEALRIGRTRMYRLIREGAVRSVKVGQSRRVPVQALHDYVSESELAAYPPAKGFAGPEVVAPDTYDGCSRAD